MKLAGTFEVPAERGVVFDFLTDPGRIAPALPDVERYSIQEDGAFTADARVGVSFIHGTMHVSMRLEESVAGDTARYRGTASGLGSSVNLEAGFSLEDGLGAGTTVRWSGDARVVGRLASVGGGLLEPLAQKNIARFVEGIRSALAGADSVVSTDARQEGHA